MFNIIKSITLSYLALSTMVGATSPGTPHLNSRHLFIIKDHPISEKVISEMRNGMAVRKASAGPDMSDEEVLGRILSIAGWDQVNELQPADQNNKAESDRQQEVDSVRSFVKAVLSFLSRTEAAKKLDFEIYIPVPKEEKKDASTEAEKQSSEPADGDLLEQKIENVVRGDDTEPAEVSKKSESKNPAEASATTSPAGISFAEALDLIIPLWPSVSPPSASASEAEADLVTAKQNRERVLEQTKSIFLHIMSDKEPLGYQNDKQIWQSVSNLLHLYLSPPVSSADNNKMTFESAHKQAKAQFEILSTRLKSYAKDHPYRLGAQVAVGVVGFFPGLVLGPVLGALGFGASGVLGGSIAAGWQASLAGGSPVVGSLFSMCQSLAMGGSLGGPLVAGVSAVMGTVGSGLGFTARGSGTEGKDGNEEPKEAKGEEEL